MSDDLKTTLQDMAREPRHGLDMAELKRSANRLMLRSRAFAASTAVAVATGGYAAWNMLESESGVGTTSEGQVCALLGNEVSLFLRESARVNIAELHSYLAMLPEVEEVEYTSPSEAHKAFLRTLPNYVEGPGPMHRGQLPGSFVLTLTDGVDVESFITSLPRSLPVDEARVALAEDESQDRCMHPKPQGTQPLPPQLREGEERHKAFSAMNPLEARIVGRVSKGYKWAVTIDKGRDDGLEKDMAVIERRGLVGRVVAVEAHEATVLLIIDPDAAAAARLRRSQHTGTVQGRGPNRPFSMDFVPGEAKVTLGEVVVTSGFDDGIFPPGITIGKVADIAGESSDLQQAIDVKPSVDFNALEYVHVLLQSGPNLGR